MYGQSPVILTRVLAPMYPKAETCRQNLVVLKRRMQPPGELWRDLLDGGIAQAKSLRLLGEGDVAEIKQGGQVAMRNSGSHSSIGWGSIVP